MTVLGLQSFVYALIYVKALFTTEFENILRSENRIEEELLLQQITDIWNAKNKPYRWKMKFSIAAEFYQKLH